MQRGDLIEKGERILSAINLSKRFRSGYALRKVNITIGREKVAVLGPNGSGKTTFVKIAAGILRQSSGKIVVFNSTPANPEVRKRIGLVSHNPMLYSELTVFENLRFYSKIFHTENFEGRIEELASSLNFKKILNEKVGDLSRGYLQRVSIARALLQNPELLIMDEATAGLDSRTRRKIIEFMKNTDGALVFTTHLVDEAEFCERFIVLNAGEVVYDGEDFEYARSLLMDE